VLVVPDPVPVVIDALDDYRTCARCRRVRPVDQPVCPHCALIDSLTVERFGHAS
jgi:hypothetical protein